MQLLYFEDFTGEPYNATNPNGTPIPEIWEVDGWKSFWRENAAEVIFRPEMLVIDAEPPYLDPPRTNGIRGLKVFKIYSRHDAGYYKQFTIPAGTSIVQVNATGHHWYSRRDDPYKSEYYDDNNVWHALEDGDEGATIMVGVDRAGGTDAFASSVEWAEANIYDGFVTVSLGLTSPGYLITVFIRSTQLWPFKHTDCYWSDVEILADSAPEPPECYGLPREQYARRYNVYPTWATAERREAIAEICAGRQETCGPSYDDAGLGALEDKTAVLWDIPADQRAAFIDFFETYYPGTVVEFAGDSPEPPEPLPISLFCQCDEPWGSQHIADSGLTMCQSGCAVTSCAMIGSQVESDTDPLQLLSWLEMNGGFADGGRIYWAKVAEYYGIQFKGYYLWRDPGQVADMAVVRAALARGPVIIQVDYYPNTDPLDSHFVVALREVDGDIEIADPWFGEVKRLGELYWLGSLAESIKAMVDYRLDETPLPPVSPIRPVGTRGNIILHHMPTGPEGVTEFLSTIRPPAHLVVVGGAGELQQARAASPASLLALRRVEDDLPLDNPQAAYAFVDRYLQQLQGTFDLTDFSKPPIYIASINERGYECGNHAGILQGVAWDIGFMDAVEATGLNIRAIVYKAAVGNPHTTADDLSLLLPMVERAVRGKHLLGKHSYYASVPSDPTFYQQSWDWYGGRFAQDDAYFVSRGLKPYWLFAEGGACMATLYPTAMKAYASASFVPIGRDWPNRIAVVSRNEAGKISSIAPIVGGLAGTAYSSMVATTNSVYVSLSPGDGWKSCGDIERYARELVWANQWYTNWNNTHEGRLLGCALFTTGGWGWDKFQLQGGDLAVVTAALNGAL
jgi:hypothetical protein